MAQEAASFPDGVSDSASIHLMPPVDSSAPKNVEEAQEQFHRLSIGTASPAVAATVASSSSDLNSNNNNNNNVNTSTRQLQSSSDQSSTSESSFLSPNDIKNENPSSSSSNFNFSNSSPSSITPTAPSSSSTPPDPLTLNNPKSYPLIHCPQDTPEHLKISGRIINALSNLPHAIVHNPDTNTFDIRHRRGNSALYSALNLIKSHKEWESVIVAWTGEIESTNTTAMDNVPQEDVDQKDLKPETIKYLEERLNAAEVDHYGQVHPVWLLGRDQSRWREYAENIIWPILHYIQGEPTDGRREQGWWRDYVTLNEAYAEKIISVYQEGDIIWVHDYYLLLLPQILRMKLPKAYIGVFLHSPFPSSEYFRLLPKRKELLEGMLGANLVATQSYAFSRHFISACTRLLNLESSPNYISAYGVHVSVDTIPIGIDAERVEREAFDNSVDAKVKALQQLYPGKKLIIGRDRLDSVRGVVQKLYAFEMFLNLYPEWINKVILIQVTSPAYSNTIKTEKKIAEMIAHINGTYGTLEYVPIQHYPRHVARDEYFALLRAADLGLITSVRDGMNTTSLEFVVCQKKKHSPLVLSEFTGTAGLLVDSIQVNPWDSVGVAQTIHQCLMQSEERNQAVESNLYTTVTSNTVQDWVVRFLSRLVHNLSRHDQSYMTPTLDRALLLQKYQNASKRLFLFDYDGTLTPIVREPSAAIPSARLYKTLELLTADPRNHVWIISGRDSQFLDQWLGRIKALGFSAEHGCFLKSEGNTEWVNLAQQVDMSWRKAAQEIFNYFTERTQGSHVEVKQAALTWHHRRADPEFGQFQAHELKKQLEKKLLPKYDVEIMTGKANIEVRPRQFNKGEIVKRLIREFGEPDGEGDATRPGFIYCLGDDATDEDMFKILRNISLSNESLSAGPISAPSTAGSVITADGLELKESVSETNEKATKAAYERGADGLFPVTVGPANKKTQAAWHLIDPFAVLDSLAVLTGEIPLQEVIGVVSINERGEVRQ